MEESVRKLRITNIYSDYIIMISYYFESLMDGYIGYVEGKNKL